jgi:hypothetical protein
VTTTTFASSASGASGPVVTSAITTTTGTVVQVISIYGDQTVTMANATYVNYDPTSGTNNILFTPPPSHNGSWTVGSQVLYVPLHLLFYI